MPATALRVKRSPVGEVRRSRRIERLPGGRVLTKRCGLPDAVFALRAPQRQASFSIHPVHALGVAFAANDHVIEQVALATPHEALCGAVLPWALNAMIFVLTHLSVPRRLAGSPARSRLAAIWLEPKPVERRLTLDLVKEHSALQLAGGAARRFRYSRASHC